MFLLRYKIIRRIIWIGSALIIFLLWNYFHDLRVRFPHMDFRQTQFGIASWYSEEDENIQKHTASGELFDDEAMTCASWDYPFGKKLLVINLFNAKWIVCRVNDRGPAKRLGRKIDLTKSAFRKIANSEIGLIFAAVIPTEKTKSSAEGRPLQKLKRAAGA